MANLVAPQSVRSYNRDGRVPLRDIDHPLQAFREERVVGMDDLAVFGFAGKQAQRVVPVRHDREEVAVLVEGDARVAVGVRTDDLGGPIRAAVVYDEVLPVVVCLREHALDALGQVALAVVDGCHHPDEGPGAHARTPEGSVLVNIMRDQAMIGVNRAGSDQEWS
jgi:hypothetical protein